MFFSLFLIKILKLVSLVLIRINWKVKSPNGVQEGSSSINKNLWIILVWSVDHSVPVIFKVFFHQPQDWFCKVYWGVWQKKFRMFTSFWHKSFGWVWDFFFLDRSKFFLLLLLFQEEPSDSCCASTSLLPIVAFIFNSVVIHSIYCYVLLCKSFFFMYVPEAP